MLLWTLRTPHTIFVVGLDEELSHPIANYELSHPITNSDLSYHAANCESCRLSFRVLDDLELRCKSCKK